METANIIVHSCADCPYFKEGYKRNVGHYIQCNNHVFYIHETIDKDKFDKLNNFIDTFQIHKKCTLTTYATDNEQTIKNIQSSYNLKDIDIKKVFNIYRSDYNGEDFLSFFNKHFHIYLEAEMQPFIKKYEKSRHCIGTLNADSLEPFFNNDNIDFYIVNGTDEIKRYIIYR